LWVEGSPNVLLSIIPRDGCLEELETKIIILLLNEPVSILLRDETVAEYSLTLVAQKLDHLLLF
jgi:adenylate kinase